MRCMLLLKWGLHCVRWSFWLGLVVSSVAWAACPTIDEFEVGAQSRLQQRVDEAPPECENVAGFLALKGRLLLTGGQKEDALVWLEKAVMLAPNEPVILLEYAYAARQLGDVVLAKGIAEQLLAQADMPRVLREELTQWLADFQARPMVLSKQYRSVLLGVGYDSNINSGSSQSFLQLTLPSGNLSLGLDDKLTAQAAWYAQSHLQWRGVYKTTWAEALGVRLGVQARQPFGLRDNFSQQQVDFEVSAAHPIWAPAVRSHWVRAQYVEYAGQGLVGSLSSGAVWRAEPALTLLPGSSCRAEKGIDGEYRDYPIERSLNGVAAGVSYAMLCENNNVSSYLHTKLQWDTPVNRAERRAGGDYWKLNIVSTWVWRQQTWQYLASLRWDYQQDTDSYTYFIENGAKRHVNQVGASLEAQYAISAGLKAYLRVESRRQSSNISLFSMKSQGIFSGVIYDF